MIIERQDSQTQLICMEKGYTPPLSYENRFGSSMAEKFKFVFAAATWEELFVCLSYRFYPFSPYDAL